MLPLFPLNLEVMLTYNCNFRCAYCYEKESNYENKNISDEVVEKTFQYIDWALNTNQVSTIGINFWGGEPTLQMDKVEKFVYRYVNEPRINFALITNGSNPDPVIKLTNYCNTNGNIKFRPQISYDFACQDRRVLKSGKSSKELVKKAIKKFVDTNTLFYLKSTILYEDLWRIEEYYDEYKKLEEELGVHLSLGITPDTTCYWGGSDLEFDIMMKKFHSGMVRVLDKVLKNNEYNFNFFSEEPNREICSVGNGYFCVDIDGSIYPCHGIIYLPNHEQYKQGSIDERKIFDLTCDNFVEPEKCQKCDTRFCYKCNAHTLARSKLDKFDQKWVDYANNEKHCRIHKEISKFQYAMMKIRPRVLY